MISHPIIFIDGHNTAIRHYSKNPSINTVGEQTGLIIGFLKEIESLAERFHPKKIVVAWDGVDGSKRRRKLYPDYKMHRKPQNLNRFYDDDIPDTNENKVWQLVILSKMLRFVPVEQVYVNECEADDVIACFCRGLFRDENKMIVSSDQDYLQLINEKTIVYSPTKRIFVTENVVKEKFGVSIDNFALAKSLAGDRSDGIKGVRTVGFKTIKKKLPELLNEKLTLDEFKTLCESKRGKKTNVYSRILDSFEELRTNFKIVDLNDPWMIDSVQLKKIEEGIVGNKSMNKLGVMSLLQEANINNYNVATLFGKVGYLSL